FFELLFVLRRLLDNPQRDKEEAQEQARRPALTRCLRAYRGVPDLGRAGVCNTHDVVYLRGLSMVEQAIAQDGTIPELLSAGKFALEQLDDMKELGILSSQQPLMKLAFHPDLDS